MGILANLPECLSLKEDDVSHEEEHGVEASMSVQLTGPKLPGKPEGGQWL